MRIQFIGLVADFEGLIEKLDTLVQQFEPSFKGNVVRSNVSGKSSTSADEDVINLLTQSNLDDARILTHAEALLASQ